MHYYGVPICSYTHSLLWMCFYCSSNAYYCMLDVAHAEWVLLVKCDQYKIGTQHSMTEGFGAQSDLLSNCELGG